MKKIRCQHLYIYNIMAARQPDVFLCVYQRSQTASCVLLALVSVLAQSLLTLVSSHLVALVLLSVRHNS